VLHNPDLQQLGLVLLITLAAPGGAFLLLGLWRLAHDRLLRGSAELGTGGLLLALAAVAGVLALNAYTYQRLTHEQPAGWISFSAEGPQRFTAILHTPPLPDREFLLVGDEWQLDARILKWKPPATLLGLDTGYRFERLAGRYRGLAEEREGLRTVYDLGTPGSDLLALLDRASRKLPWVDAYYGNSTYLPMAAGAVYRISVSQSGLVARPANPEAEYAVEKWR
jgi:hypothetical protein